MDMSYRCFAFLTLCIDV